MARPLSRIGRLCLAFAGGAAGVGVAIVVSNGHHPALHAIIGILIFFFVALPGIGRGVGGVARAIERRRLNKRRRSSGAPETEAHEKST
jgi:hypothetical protein